MIVSWLRIMICICLLGAGHQAVSQTYKILVNSADTVYDLTGGVGNCSYAAIKDLCPVANGHGIFSSALYNDVLYFISNSKNNLYSVKLGVPGSCTYLTNFPATGPFGDNSSINSMTVDKAGMIYTVDYWTGAITRFDPVTRQKSVIGRSPSSPGGDLIFYKDKLLLATLINGIWEIDLKDPAAATLFMATENYQFYGLISFPFECDKNKAYGFNTVTGGTELIELDLENRKIVGPVCMLPFQVFDGASIVETGNTVGVQVDTIIIQAPCKASENTGDVNIVAYSASPGELTYTVNNSIVNKTGKFNGLPLGNYSVQITNSAGCKKDTFFTIEKGLSGTVNIVSSNPESCDLLNGSIAIHATSFYQPVTFSINNGTPQDGNTFPDLGAGFYAITVRDQGNCRLDTSVILQYKVRPNFLGDIKVFPTVCNARSGSIRIGINGNAAGIKVSLNGGSQQSSPEFNSLDAGRYTLSIYNTGNCRYDTVIQVRKVEDTRPSITLRKNDQLCFDNNGGVQVEVSGQGAPFQYNFNNAGFTDLTSFGKLSPGQYAIQVRNANFCEWDTVVEILPYPKLPVKISMQQKDPTCKELNSGEIRIAVSGNEAPYYLKWKDQLVGNASVIRSPHGEFTIPVLNKDKCAIDSVKMKLDLIVFPECDRVMMPNAFSPNDDGKNDVFRPIHGPYITNTNLAIYNRYGQKVFQSSDAVPGWDGRFKGQQLDQGHYVWVLIYENFMKVQRKMNGSVILIR
jgi:gliding motility-associated-like protein